jgi:hypothetical protein
VPPAPEPTPAPAGPALPQRALSWPVLAAVAVLPSVAAWVAGKAQTFRDTGTLYAPARGFVTEALRAGRLPLWNPFEGTGKPLFAEGMHGVLHPVSLLAALLDPGGVELMIALYLAAAAVGTYLLARELGLERPHAFVAGSAFALSGFVVSQTGNLVFLAGAASMPWQVAALAAVGRGARHALPLAALATAVTLFSGDAQVALVAAVLGAALAAERSGWRGAARAVAAAALGGLLAAVQLLPTLAAVEVSPRATGLDDAQRLQYALSPWRLLELIVPGLFVRFDAIDSLAAFAWLGGPTGIGQGMPFSPSIYLGIPAVALAACAPFRDRRVRVLAVAGAVLLWLSLGHVAGARQALEWIPIWGAFRYSEKMVGPLTLLLALLAAFGARGTDGAGPSRRRASLIALAGTTLVLLALGVASTVTSDRAQGAEALAANLRAGLPHALLGGAAIVAAAWGRAPWRPLAFAVAVAAPLLGAVPNARVPMPSEPCHAWPGALVSQPPAPRVVVPFLASVVPSARALPASPTWPELLASDYCGRARLGLVAQNVQDRIGNFWSYGGLGSARHALLTSTLPYGGAYGARYFSVTHASIVARKVGPTAEFNARATRGGTLVASDPEYGSELYAIPHLPWARFAPSVVAVGDPQAAAKLFAQIVESDRDIVVVETTARVPAGRGQVRAVSWESERISVEVDAFAEGLLVVNDAFWPGWVARVDGREAPILAANVLARGVVIPEGRHTLTMDYEPPELRWGLALTALGVLVCGALVAPSRRRRDRSAARP